MNPVTRHWYFDPYLHLGLCIITVTAAEVFLKIGATTNSYEPKPATPFGIDALAWPATWVGIFLYILSFLSWLYVLRLLPLSTAYSLMSVVYVLVPCAAWLILEESISARRWAGLGLVMVGALLVASQAANVEKKL